MLNVTWDLYQVNVCPYQAANATVLYETKAWQIFYHELILEDKLVFDRSFNNKRRSNDKASRIYDELKFIALNETIIWFQVPASIYGWLINFWALLSHFWCLFWLYYAKRRTLRERNKLSKFCLVLKIVQKLDNCTAMCFKALYFT